MKMWILLGALLVSGAARAMDYECIKQVSPERSEFAQIVSWPRLMVATSYKECRRSGDTELCSMGRGDTIADDFSVCFGTYDVKHECHTMEQSDGLMMVVNCGFESVMQAEINPDGQGVISCTESGVLRKQWQVGHCHKR